MNHPDQAGFFYDFSCLPQRPRLPEEDARFSAALSQVNTCYISLTGNASLVLPLGEPLELAQRAWCVMELSSAMVSQCLFGYLDEAKRECAPGVSNGLGFAGDLGRSMREGLYGFVTMSVEGMRASVESYVQRLYSGEVKVTNGSDLHVVERGLVRNICLLIERAAKSADEGEEMQRRVAHWTSLIEDAARSARDRALTPKAKVCCVLV